MRSQEILLVLKLLANFLCSLPQLGRRGTFGVIARVIRNMWLVNSENRQLAHVAGPLTQGSHLFQYNDKKPGFQLLRAEEDYHLVCQHHVYPVGMDRRVRHPQHDRCRR